MCQVFVKSSDSLGNQPRAPGLVGMNPIWFWSPYFTVLLNVSSSSWHLSHFCRRKKTVYLLLVLDKLQCPCSLFPSLPFPSLRWVLCPTLPRTARIYKISNTHTYLSKKAKQHPRSWHRIASPWCHKAAAFTLSFSCDSVSGLTSRSSSDTPWKWIPLGVAWELELKASEFQTGQPSMPSLTAWRNQWQKQVRGAPQFFLPLWRYWCLDFCFRFST